MLTPPLLSRAGELHRHQITTGIARDRQGTMAIAGTRMRGGFFHLVTVRLPRPESAEPPTWKPRPAVV